MNTQGISSSPPSFNRSIERITLIEEEHSSERSKGSTRETQKEAEENTDCLRRRITNDDNSKETNSDPRWRTLTVDILLTTTEGVSDIVFYLSSDETKESDRGLAMNERFKLTGSFARPLKILI